MWKGRGSFGEEVAVGREGIGVDRGFRLFKVSLGGIYLNLECFLREERWDK